MKNLKLTLIILMVAIAPMSAIAIEQSINRTQNHSELVSAYLSVKDALVKTNAKNASEAAMELAKILDGKNDENSAKLKEDALAISKSTDIKIQRKHFNTLSQTMYSMVKDRSNTPQGLYKQYCPMAFNNTGAFWLASEKDINNPYFGSKMLKCGMVKEVL